MRQQKVRAAVSRKPSVPVLRSQRAPHVLASAGVLPIALGGATRFIQYLQDKKVYETSIKFGTSTTSDDVTG